jgi:hypothetical protein
LVVTAVNLFGLFLDSIDVTPELFKFLRLKPDKVFLLLLLPQVIRVLTQAALALLGRAGLRVVAVLRTVIHLI